MVQLAAALQGAHIGTLGISRGQGWMGALEAQRTLVREAQRSAKRRWHHSRRAPRSLHGGGGRQLGHAGSSVGNGSAGQKNTGRVGGELLGEDGCWEECFVMEKGHGSQVRPSRRIEMEQPQVGWGPSELERRKVAFKQLMPARRLAGTLCGQQDVRPRATGAQERLTCPSPEGAYTRGASTARGPIRKSNEGTWKGSKEPPSTLSGLGVGTAHGHTAHWPGGSR